MCSLGAACSTSNIAEGYGYARSDASLALCDLELVFVPGLFVNEASTCRAVTA